MRRAQEILDGEMTRAWYAVAMVMPFEEVRDLLHDANKRLLAQLNAFTAKEIS